jgi:hypothetical protein
MTFSASLWVERERITTTAAIDDLLADSVGWNVRDLMVQLPARSGAAPDFDRFGHLVRGGAAVGVRIHAWADRLRSLDAAGELEDIVRRYPVEGLHLDQAEDPRVTGAHPPGDRSASTAIVREAIAGVRAARPGIVISAAVLPIPADLPVPAVPIDAHEQGLQPWPEWAAEQLVDLVCPMAYRTETAEVRRLLGAARAAAPSTRMWGGLMAYAGERPRARDQVRAARDAGCDGVILFGYDPALRDVIDAFAAESARAA